MEVNCFLWSVRDYIQTSAEPFVPAVLAWMRTKHAGSTSIIHLRHDAQRSHVRRSEPSTSASRLCTERQHPGKLWPPACTYPQSGL